MSRKFQVCFKKVSGVFQGILKGVSRVVKGYFQEVQKVFQESIKGVSRKCQLCLKEV